MKDDDQDSYKPTYTQSLPPCSKNSQCLDFVDELSAGTAQNGAMPEDERDAKNLELLRLHVPTCPTCTSTLIHARAMVAQQRRALRAILDEGEQKVPSTTAHIMMALRQEQQKVLVSINTPRRNVSSIVPFPQGREIETPLPKRTGRGLYVFALAAVAALLVASFGFFSYILPLRSVTTASSAVPMRSSIIPTPIVTQNTANPPAVLTTWSSVVITYQINNTTIIANYNPLSQKGVTLATSPYADTTVNGVSHLGHMILYSTYDGLKTSYYIYPQATTHAVYSTAEKDGSAVWSTDDRYVFISTTRGVAQVDVQTRQTRTILPMLASTALLNYRDGYLYFIKGYQGQAYVSEGVLYRADLATEHTQAITPCERGTNFWISPGGLTVYYACPYQDTSLYAVRSDGVGARVFRSTTNTMVGYVENGSPLTVTPVDGKSQIVQRDLADPIQDKVLLKDVAPGAQTVTPDSVAVAPYGQVLVAKGMYNGSDVTTAQLWYSDLQSGKSQKLKLEPNAHNPLAIGWDKLAVS